MPRIAGLNIVAAIAAALVVYFIGFVIYGLVFGEVWAQQTLVDHGLARPEEAASISAEQMESMHIPGELDTTLAMSLGFIISLVTAIFVGVALKLMKPATLGAAMGCAVVLWVGFGATTLAYDVVYSSDSRINFGIDLLNLLLSYLAASAVFFLVDRKAISGTAASGSG